MLSNSLTTFKYVSKPISLLLNQLIHLIQFKLPLTFEWKFCEGKIKLTGNAHHAASAILEDNAHIAETS